jgi:hypothetical protein
MQHSDTEERCYVKKCSYKNCGHGLYVLLFPPQMLFEVMGTEKVQKRVIRRYTLDWYSRVWPLFQYAHSPMQTVSAIILGFSMKAGRDKKNLNQRKHLRLMKRHLWREPHRHVLVTLHIQTKKREWKRLAMLTVLYNSVSIHSFFRHCVAMWY